VALREALGNAICHGNLEIMAVDSDEEQANLIAAKCQQAPYRDRRVHFTVRESRSEVVYVVRDEGSGFDPARLPDHKDPANLEKFSERGLRLIYTFMDEVHHNAIGNEITMIKRRRT
jgi:anti-sigma regulatory factor (Ser/Thr protein kinase)